MVSCWRARRVRERGRLVWTPRTDALRRGCGRRCWRWTCRSESPTCKNIWWPDFRNRGGGLVSEVGVIETFGSRLRTYASFVRVSHTVFALPFALVGAVLAARTYPLTWGRVAWIVAAMLTARSAAMGFNRLVDARYDALNPRTATRELPRGAMSRGEAILFVIVSSALFVFCAHQLGRVTFLLSPLALAIVFWYSLAKRVTSYTQLFLGLAMAVAP